MDALEEFKNVSGLVSSIPKSTAFFCNVSNALKANILSSMLFVEGTLPVRYLGVPLISSKLLYRDCLVSSSCSSSVPHRLVDVFDFLIPTKRTLVSNVISRIVLSATTYCLWNERNLKLFKKKKSTADQIVQLIISLDTGKDEVIPYEKFGESHKKMISKNDEAKMVLYNALPKKEKFLRALPTKWHPKVTVIKESKDLSTLSLDELIGNLKVYEVVVLEKDSQASKIKKEKYKSLSLKARKTSSDKEESCSGSDEEYAMAERDFKNFFRRRGKFVRQPYDDKKNLRKVKEEKKGKEERRCFKCGDLNQFISDYPKHSVND
uniref:Reverse transcriptase domain, reverse transcriptase zinc-binding domain protein n=1 Tax=Tanacetum cinerariifolium TaxID=118510 RepID=A0A6L2JSC9_TANCI|nr:reverse transcriptase domain, reverse transcriptase zinc-binding domain protein [Tanacetum cinerariifolium]